MVVFTLDACTLDKPQRATVRLLSICSFQCFCGLRSAFLIFRPGCCAPLQEGHNNQVCGSIKRVLWPSLAPSRTVDLEGCPSLGLSRGSCGQVWCCCVLLGLRPCTRSLGSSPLGPRPSTRSLGSCTVNTSPNGPRSAYYPFAP